jgi:glycosyltransferase involved in cell wall biosynthesis
VADFCVREGHFPADKVLVIPNGVDLARFAGATAADLTPLGIASPRRAIVYVGRLDRQKGLDALLRALPARLKSLPDHDLLLVGEGPERLPLSRLADELKIGHRVHFAGQRDDVPAVLAASDLLILPSRWEGMPNVILEAMAAQKPVVAMQVEGVQELLGPGFAAQTASPGDYEAFLDRIIHLSQNPLIASEWALRNRQRAEELFSLTGLVSRYERLFQSLAEGRGLPKNS